MVTITTNPRIPFALTVALARTDDAIRTLAPIAAPIAARASFGEYVRQMFPGEYDMQPHHALIIDKLEAVERGEITRLMVFVAPRRGKSALTSVHFPAWYLGRHPDDWIMGCSHTASLAHDFSRKVRRQLSDPVWPFDAVTIRRDEAAVGQWGIAGHEGGYIAAGVGGSLTGRGSKVLLIDDPTKSRAEAMSATYRDRAWEWYMSDAYTRLAPGGAIVLVMTRWHMDDLAGRLMAAEKDGGDKWDIVQLREIAEEGEVDPLGRKPGEYLWPSRWPASSTDVIRTTQAAVWESLFQQRPGAERGTMFLREWFDDENRYDLTNADGTPAPLPEFLMLVMSVDGAFSTNVNADRSAIAVWGITKTHLYLLDAWAERVDYISLLQAIRDKYNHWVDRGYKRLWVYIENKASGQSAIQTLRRESRMPIQEYNPGNVAKESRAQDVTPYFGTGRVRIPRRAPFLSEWIEEHVKFPTAEHDDYVDTSVPAIKALTRAVRLEGVASAVQDTAAA